GTQQHLQRPPACRATGQAPHPPRPIQCPGVRRDAHSFPTRRSSDLGLRPRKPCRSKRSSRYSVDIEGCTSMSAPDNGSTEYLEEDRKSTRLNSSHVETSYAVFCLKKKTKNPTSASSSRRDGNAGVAL